MPKQTKNYTWWQYYLLEFMIFGGLVTLLFILHNHVMIWGADGFIMFHTTAQYADTFWTNLLHGHVTIMDMTIGEGLNPLQYMTYYGLLEPWNILYAITPDSWTVHIESIILLCKWLASGLAFGYYAKQYSNNQQAISIGALIYVTSGYFMMWMSAHIFLNAGFLLPLLLYALETSIERKRPIYFLLLTAFAYITNYYVAAIMSFMLLIYGIVYISTHKYWKQWRQWMPTVLAHALGILISMCVLLPCIYAILHSVRNESHTGMDNIVLYPWQYYLNMIHQFFMPNSDTILYWKHTYQAQLNFFPIALPCVIHLLLHKTTTELTKRMKGLVIAFGLFLCFPIFGRIFNANTYTTHRWTVALSMLVAMISVWAIPQLNIDKRMRCIIWGYTLIAILLSLLFADTPYILFIGILILLITWQITFFPLRISLKNVQRISILCFVFGGLVLNYSLGQYNTRQAYMTQEYDYYLRLQETTSIDKRAGQINQLLGVNTGTAHQQYTNTSGWNMMSTYESEYYNNAQLLPDMFTPSWFSGTDDRSAMQVLSGVEYYLTTDTSMGVIPIGFKYSYTVSTELDDGDIHVYQNTCNPGIGYMYYQSMSQEQFNQLDIAARQLALMQYAIVQESADAIYPNSITLPYTAKHAEGEIIITTNIPAGYEVYWYCNEVLLNHVDTWKVSALSEKNDDQVDVSITVNDNKNGKNVNAWWPARHLAMQHGIRTVCLGSNLQGETTITIAYDDTVQLGEIQLFAFPVSDFQVAAQALKNNSLTNIQYDKATSTLTGEIDAKKNGILQIAIPYSDGWTAYVDGQPADIFASGIKYIGLRVNEGVHTVELRYHTPGLLTGVLISSVATAITIIWLIIDIHCKRYVKCKE